MPKRSNIEVRGQSFPSIKAAAEHFKVDYRTAQSRMRRGDPLEVAFGLDDTSYHDCPKCRAIHIGTTCYGCLDLKRLGIEPHPQLAPKCFLCRTTLDPNGHQLRWGMVYSGIETGLIPTPVCVDCTPFLRESLRGHYETIAKRLKATPAYVQATLERQNGVCYHCEKPMDEDDTVLVDRTGSPHLTHAACRLDLN